MSLDHCSWSAHFEQKANIVQPIAFSHIQLILHLHPFFPICIRTALWSQCALAVQVGISQARSYAEATSAYSVDIALACKAFPKNFKDTPPGRILSSQNASGCKTAELKIEQPWLHVAMQMINTRFSCLSSKSSKILRVFKIGCHFVRVTCNMKENTIDTYLCPEPGKALPIMCTLKQREMMLPYQ